MLDKEFGFGTMLTGLQYVLASLQDNELFQNIQFILSIISAFVVLAFTIWKWWKKASEDKKITQDEIEEGIDIIVNGIDYVESELDKRGDFDD